MKTPNPSPNTKEEKKIKDKRRECPICKALGGHPAIGCVGDVFVTNYPKYDK